MNLKTIVAEGTIAAALGFTALGLGAGVANAVPSSPDRAGIPWQQDDHGGGGDWGHGGRGDGGDRGWGDGGGRGDWGGGGWGGRDDWGPPCPWCGWIPGW
jgi:hypothetical protein